jgi:hypothetical protein
MGRNDRIRNSAPLTPLPSDTRVAGMGLPLRAVALLLVSISISRAEGWVNFSTRSGLVNAPVFDGRSATSLVNGEFYGQLMAGSSTDSMIPIGPAEPFRSDAGRGYITAGGSRLVPTVDHIPGGISFVRLLVWWAPLGGTTYESYQRFLRCEGDSIWAMSNIIEIHTSQPDTPEPAAALIGLEGFSVIWPAGDLWKYHGSLSMHVGGDRNPELLFSSSINDNQWRWRDHDWIVEASDNLVVWNTVATFTNVVWAGFKDTNSLPIRFFRVRRPGCD